MPSPDDKRISKFLSLVLRHEPHLAGLTLDPAGWVAVDALLAGAETAGQPISRADLERVVAESDKQRFTFSADRSHIRAAQGHSVEVELGLEPRTPPETLWHGTAERSLTAIVAEGLKPQTRRHVHLSPDPDAAHRVSQRHGKPVVLNVAAGAAHRAGQVFWQADNGVWLTGPLGHGFLSAGAAR